jgi:hypothetical protein
MLAFSIPVALAAETGSEPDFAGVAVSAEVRQLARWALASGDAAGRHLVLVDKRRAHTYVLDARGRLLGHAPALLGLARGDDTVAGIGERPLSQVRPQERTTPAGRFLPEPGWIAVFAQQKDARWGNAPDTGLRNGDWRYGVFDGAGRSRDVSLAPCFACHLQARAAQDYTFTLWDYAATLGSGP